VTKPDLIAYAPRGLSREEAARWIGEAAYRAAIEGRSKSAQPASQRSLRAAWIILTTKTPEWRALAATSRRQQTRIAEAFLRMPVAAGMTMGDVAMADLERRHVKAILAARSFRRRLPSSVTLPPAAA
jgi:hypothetical protein